MSEVFALVSNGRLYEYPVTRSQIVNRGLTVSQFLPVRFDHQPAKVPAYHFAKEVPEIFEDHVQIHYQVTPIALEQLLIRVYHPDGVLNEGNPNATIADVPADLFNAIIAAIKVEVQERLDAFARERGYDGIVSAITYRDSVVEQFRNDANRCINIRDTSWAQLYQYLAQLQQGTVALPKNKAEIMAMLPATT